LPDLNSEAKDFVEKFKKEYKIPKMDYKDMGFVKSWIYEDEKRCLNLKASIFKKTKNYS